MWQTSLRAPTKWTAPPKKTGKPGVPLTAESLDLGFQVQTGVDGPVIDDGECFAHRILPRGVLRLV